MAQLSLRLGGQYSCFASAIDEEKWGFCAWVKDMVDDKKISEKRIIPKGIF